MCYICKYKEYQYSTYTYHTVVQKFIQYIHEEQFPIHELYKARDQYLTFHQNKTRGRRSNIRTMINRFISDVAREENIKIVEDVMTFTMKRDGSYTQTKHVE